MNHSDDQMMSSLELLEVSEARPVDRRQALKSLSLFAAATMLWSCVRSPEEPAGFNADDQLALVTEICDLVIPATEGGPAASSVDVPRFVLLAIDNGLVGTNVPASAEAPDYLRWLKAELDLRTNGNFLAALPEIRENALDAVDAAAFRDHSAPTPWLKIKHLILIGYYTSQVGGSEVLRYEDLPGEFRGDVVIQPGMKAQSNDWTAVKYG